MQRDLFRLYRACVKLSNFSWYVLTMVDPENGTPGDTNRQPLAREELEVLLRDALAISKRSNEEISEQRRQQASILKKLDSLQQGGLTEDGNKARIAPGKLRSCVLKSLDMMFLLVEDKFCSLRGIWLVSRHPACFLFKWPSVPWRRLSTPREAYCLLL